MSVAEKRVSKLREDQPVQISRWRIYATLIFCLLLVTRVLLRLGELQIFQSAALTAMARKEINKQITLQPSRGMITDRQGNILAMDVDRQSLWAIPSQISAERAPRLALSLASLTGQDAQKILASLTSKDQWWLPVVRWLEPKVAAQIAALEESGLRLIHEPRRIYPQGDSAAHVVGAVNYNGDGISGIESFYNTELKGITGTMTAEFDGVRQPIAIAPQQTEPARDGATLHLTLDPVVQHIAETELAKGIKKHQADGGSVIILEPSTGAIRGMASWPTFDPNRYADFTPETYGRNPAISILYEPGSTLKIFTVAAGLQSRAFTADTLVNDNGVIERFGLKIHNWDYKANGMINPGEMLYYSSNVAAVHFNELTGPEKFYQYINDFGFGQKTNIDLGGEERGIVHDPTSPNYSDIMLLANAYGQSISVTPLQIAVATAAIANDGLLMKPYMVEQRCDGNYCVTTQPTKVKQVVEQGVAWTLRRMLVRSANHYAHAVWETKTGSKADQWLVPGYQVGAKTGTASIPLPTGEYDPYTTIVSVAGFVPAENAKYAMIVKIDRPKDDIWGTNTVVPIFYRIVDQLVRHERLPPDPTLFSPGQ